MWAPHLLNAARRSTPVWSWRSSTAQRSRAAGTRAHAAFYAPWTLTGRRSCRWGAPWACSELCPFNVGPHWLGGYQEVNTGLVLAQQPSKKEQRSDSPRINSMNHCIRSFPSAKVRAWHAWQGWTVPQLMSCSNGMPNGMPGFPVMCAMPKRPAW